MLKGQNSVNNGIENFLCPFTDMYISQGANGAYSHKGTMANDVRGKTAGIRYPYYAPCTCKCLKIYPESGQVMWQSVKKVRFANNRIDYATFMTAHDDSLNVKVGQIVKQGEQLGNMGTKGNATGVHCHIEVSQSQDPSWTKNKYGNYCFKNEYDLDECYFTDNTNIIYGRGGNWKTTKNSITITTSNDEVVDQIIHIGSKVKFDGIFTVDILKRNSNLFGNSILTGESYKQYHSEKAKNYHWIPLDDWTEVDKYGNSQQEDQKVIGGKSFVLNKNTYIVKNIDINTNSSLIEINGHEVWIYSKYLYEV